MPLKPGVRCATKTKNDGGKYTICWGEKKKPVKTTPKKTIKVSTKPVKAPKKSVTKKEPIITKPPIRRLETGALMVGKTLKAAPKPPPKKAPVAKKEEPKKDNNLLEDIKKFIEKYNSNEIKKQNLTKENLKNYTNPYFESLEKIEKNLNNVEDPLEFFKNNTKLSSSFTDIKKNFIRRIKAQLKAKPAAKPAPKTAPKKVEVKKVESDTPTEVIKYDDAFTQARTKLKKYNLRDLRKLIKTKEDVDKIVSEIIEITESLNKVQKDIQKDKIKNFLKDNTNVLKFLKSKKEAFGIDLKKTTMNINKLKQNLTSKN